MEILVSSSCIDIVQEFTETHHYALYIMHARQSEVRFKFGSIKHKMRFNQPIYIC